YTDGSPFASRPVTEVLGTVRRCQLEVPLVTISKWGVCRAFRSFFFGPFWSLFPLQPTAPVSLFAYPFSLAAQDGRAAGVAKPESERSHRGHSGDRSEQSANEQELVRDGASAYIQKSRLLLDKAEEVPLAVVAKVLGDTHIAHPAMMG